MDGSNLVTETSRHIQKRGLEGRLKAVNQLVNNILEGARRLFKELNADACSDIELRQSKYLINMVEQDHRAVKRITDPILGFKSFWSSP